MAADPYDALTPQEMAHCELDAIPKDANHPFANVPRETALVMEAQYVAERVAEIKPQNMPKKSAIDQLTSRIKTEKLKDAYRAKVAAEHLDKRADKDAKDLAKDFRKQETDLLNEVKKL